MRRLQVIGILVLACVAAAAQGPRFDANLSAAELYSLRRGETLVRSVSSPAKLALPTDAPGVEEFRNAISSLSPNYLTEIIAFLPANDMRVSLSTLDEALSSVEDYAKIPYWSVRWKKIFPLFDSVKIRGRTKSAGVQSVDVSLVMEPFDSFDARYSWARDEENEQFSCINMSPIAYKGVKAVQPGNMVWHLVLFRSGDVLVFYGVGAVRAFDMLGAMRERLEPSFVGRTEAFFSYMLERLKARP